MPFVGLGLHFLVALYFAVHAVRSGQQMYWLIILFSFPMLGSLVYFVAIYMPHARVDRGARKVAAVVSKVLDPTRELREARQAFEYTPTAQNQMRLASALLQAEQYAEAATCYETCLTGPFATDLEIRLGAARAQLLGGEAGKAVGHLDTIRAQDAAFRPEEIALLRGRALARAERQVEARAELESALQRFGTAEALGEFTIWAYERADLPLAQRLQADLDKAMSRWNKHTRELQRPLLQRLAAAKAAAERKG